MNLSALQQSIIDSEKDILFVEAAAASGKAQPDNIYIPTPNGTRRFGDLQVGDLVFDEKGQPQKILGVFPQGEKEVWRVTLTDGRQTLCCGEHLWTYSYTTDHFDGMVTETNTTEYLYKKIEEETCYIPNLSVPFEGKRGMITESPFNYGRHLAEIKKSNEYTQIQGVSMPIIIVGSHIDDNWMYATTEERSELLRGILQTIGQWDQVEKECVFTTPNYIFAKEVVFLARGLGLMCIIENNENYISGTYKVRIRMGQATEKVAIDTIEPLNYKLPMRCVLVEGENHLYLTNDFIVTHNTTVIIEKIKKEIAANKGKVVAFTFTNAAAEEMQERIGEVDKSKLFIGTIHGYCLSLLLKGGVTRALDYVEEEWFDRLFDLFKEHLECVEPLHCVICDETQDCNKAQFQFIFDYLKPTKYFCCYDRRQSIYRWRGAHPELISEYGKKLGGTKLPLNENYRNGVNILDFAKNIINSIDYSYRDYSIPKAKNPGKVISGIKYSPAAIARTIKQSNTPYSDWFILTRTNAQLEEIIPYLTREGIPHVTFKRAELNNNELNEKMKENSVKVLTIHSSKGLEAKNVVVIGANFYNVEERCVSYVAATRAKELLVWTTNSKKKMMTDIDIVSWED